MSSTIHPLAVVEEGAQLGPGCVVWRFTHVMPGARIGAGCILGQGVFVAGRVIVGDRCKIQNGVSLYDGVELGNDVFVGPSAVFTNVRRPRAAFPQKPSYARTRIGNGATIGANATLIAPLEVGPAAFIGAGSVVTHDVPAHALMTGTPARRAGWVCYCGASLHDTLLCEDCGRSITLP